MTAARKQEKQEKQAEAPDEVATLEAASTLIADGFANDNAEAVVTGIRTAMIVEAANTVRGVKATLNYRVTVGDGLNKLARLNRDAKNGGADVTPAEAEKAAVHFGMTSVQVSRSFAGICLRTVAVFAGNVETLVSVASGLFGTPTGPISMGATDLLLWAEKRAGIKAKGSNAGSPQPRDAGEKAEADKVREQAAETRDNEAKGRREELATLIAETPTHKVAGLVTYKAISVASNDALETLKQAITDLLETRSLAAKAEKASAEKQAATLKAEAEAEILEMRKQAKAEADRIIAEALAKVSA